MILFYILDFLYITVIYICFYPNITTICIQWGLLIFLKLNVFLHICNNVSNLWSKAHTLSCLETGPALGKKRLDHCSFNVTCSLSVLSNYLTCSGFKFIKPFSDTFNPPQNLVTQKIQKTRILQNKTQHFLPLNNQISYWPKMTILYLPIFNKPSYTVYNGIITD